jgi:hypothetical protein
MPSSLGTYNPEEPGLARLPFSSSPTLFSESGPAGLLPVPWTEKRSKGRHFSSDMDVIAVAEIFFGVPWKSYGNGLRSVLSFIGSMLNKSLGWSL